MYIQEEAFEREGNAPPDYRGHTYKVPERVEFSASEEDAASASPPQEEGTAEMREENEKSTPAGAFCFTLVRESAKIQPIFTPFFAPKTCTFLSQKHIFFASKNHHFYTCFDAFLPNKKLSTMKNFLFLLHY